MTLSSTFSSISVPDAQPWYATSDHTGSGTLTIGVVVEPGTFILAGADFAMATYRFGS